MNALGYSFSNRGVLIPAVIAVSLFFSFLGIRTPNLTHARNPHGHHLAVDEIQIKEAKAGIENFSEVFELWHRPSLTQPPSFHVSPLRLAYHSNGYTIVLPIPSRAPPAFPA